jgi:hypothetical protein
VPLMWSWAGRIQPGTMSDAVVGHIDLYPTLLDLLGLPRPAQQVMDGSSYAQTLTAGARFERKAFFNYFPHARNGGGVWVRAGDWKLIRWFEPGAPRELYNLRNDLGEANNLATAQPARVQELDVLIDGFLRDTGALAPIPNPNFSATAAPARKRVAGAPASAAALRGWVPKGAKTTLHEGALVVEAEGKSPFIAMTGLKQTGPVTLRLRVRSAGGPARVQWRTAAQEGFLASGQTVDFAFAASGDWSEAQVVLPVEGSLLHLRLYLPAQKNPVEIDWIELAPAGGKPQRWDF